jgi:hypothetical protein
MTLLCFDNSPTKSKIGSLPALCCLSQLVAGSTRRQNRIGRIDAEITGIRGMSVRVGISLYHRQQSNVAFVFPYLFRKNLCYIFVKILRKT